MVMEFINIADLKDPEDKQGRSYRQVNAAKKHNITIGSLVEVESGARLFVVEHTRDCDQAPLYTLSPEQETYNNTLLSKWVYGYGEEYLTVIKTESP